MSKDITALEALRSQVDAIEDALNNLRTGLISISVPPPPPDVTSFDDFFTKWDPKGEVGKRVVSVNEYSFSAEDNQKTADLKGLQWDISGSSFGTPTVYERAPVLMIKFTDFDGGPVHGGKGQWSLPTYDEKTDTWTPGDWREASDTIVTCKNGLHLTSLLNAARWKSDRAFVAEVEGPILDAGEKYVARRVRLVREIKRDDLRIIKQLNERFGENLDAAWNMVSDKDLLDTMKKMSFTTIAQVTSYLDDEERELRAQGYDVLAAQQREKDEAKREELTREYSALDMKRVLVKDTAVSIRYLGSAKTVADLIHSKVGPKAEIIAARNEILAEVFGVSVSELGELPSTLAAK